MEKLLDLWTPPSSWQRITTIDMHTGGEPLRVIISGLPEIKGDTILEQRKYFKENLDYYRTGLMWEPRGHHDMYGAVITPPVSEDADFGAFFLHNEGYSTMCGHATLALTRLALDTGLVQKQGDEPELIIDAPPGKLYAKGYREHDMVTHCSFLNVPSFVLCMDQYVDVQGLGRVRFDIAYGGAFYAFVDAGSLDLDLTPGNSVALIDAGRRIKQSVAANLSVDHPFEPELSFLYGVIFIDKPADHRNHSRNVCIFADGELDRSATGSGVSARAALHMARKQIGVNQSIRIESIIGTTMDVKVAEVIKYGPYDAVIPEVSGSAHFTGWNEFWFDPDDPLGMGFLLK